DYSFQYLYPQAAQDLVQTTIELNTTPDAAVRSLLEKPELFQALAQFVTAYPGILADFNRYLRLVNGGVVAQGVVDGARRAVEAFTTYLEAVASEHAKEVALRAMAAALPQRVRIDFASLLAGESDEADARTEIVSILIDGVPATWKLGADPGGRDATISNGTITLPAMVVQIAPEEYDAVPLPTPPENVVIAYVYVPRDGSADGNLKYGEARNIPTRTVLLPGIDVLAYQNAWSSIYVQRNKLLFPVEDSARVATRDGFLFQTPVVRFADPIVPRLAYPAFSLDTVQPVGPDGLEGRLNGFYEGLFSGGDGSTSVDVSMSGAYSYQLIPGNTQLPRISLPVTLMPPTGAAVSASTPPTFTVPFAAAVDVWRRNTHPTLDGDPQVNIGLQVFGGTSDKQPLLSVADLSLSVQAADG
ncbi:MAG: peptidoglycan-binding protein, partial [Gemmatimonadetes bacterium]|nr:peptidoglycan-binding protein [Gemmatimonadota bacterium]